MLGEMGATVEERLQNENAMGSDHVSSGAIEDWRRCRVIAVYGVYVVWNLTCNATATERSPEEQLWTFPVNSPQNPSNPVMTCARDGHFAADSLDHGDRALA
jgi:hypothetical protein